MSEIVRAEGLQRVYRMDEVEVHALRGVDLSVPQGDFAAIVGPSGCGKSTLLHLLGCLDRPTGGRVIFEGDDVSRVGDARLTRIRSRRVGFVFQTFNLMPTLSAKDNVMLQLRVAGIRGGRASKLAEEALEVVGLGHRLKHLPKQLSGGERQRVAVARAISKKPELILADEPTGNLDSVQGSQIADILAELNSRGQTILMVTHNTALAAKARRIVHMIDGRIERQEQLSPRVG
ncbi:ABC transporter ATP-binding protein [Chloroflexota bacterium]